ncbi:MAG: S8 family serine peptidase, partial [bacterium]
IIDTGIDCTHVIFDDEGYEYPEGFPLGETAFTNKKVIVARAFPVSGDTAEESTPRDREGHGTHVASCAAGRLNTPSPLGPISGVAPGAYLGNYKIFTGEYAWTEQIIAAFEACVEDGMDIVNTSFSSEEYIETTLDPEALAIRNAIASGVVVVAAAGNSGQSESIGSPGQIPEVITVGSITNSHGGSNPAEATEATMNVYVGGEQVLSGINVILGEDPTFLSRPVSGRFVILDADDLDGGSYGTTQDGLLAKDLPTDSATGKWVLAQRGSSTFSAKINRVQTAGGWGSLVYNSAGAIEGSDLPVQTPSVPGTQIPAYFVGRNPGLQIKSLIHQGGTVEVEFVGPEPSESTQTPFQMSSYSSLGPSLDYTIKPDLVAIGETSFGATQNDVPTTGTQVVTPTLFSISGFSFMSGTSFSSPRVVGAAALVKQAHPEWNPERIKSALIIAADRPAPSGTASVMTRGAGHVDVGESVDVPLLALPSKLSFRRQMIAGRTTLQKEITLENVSSTDLSASLQVQMVQNNRIESASVIFPEINLGPGKRETVTVELVVSPPAATGGIANIEGDLLISLADREEPLRVPIWATLVRAPEPTGTVLLIDDDNANWETRYEEAITAAGYDFNVWDTSQLKQYPSHEYMSKFQTVVWFMGTTSLNSVSQSELTAKLNSRIRFNTELTRYLGRGGALLVSGQDWSDQQEDTPFGQLVLHILDFNRDPYVVYDPRGRLISQVTSMDITGLSDNPVGNGISGLNLQFDGSYTNMTDTLAVEMNDFTKPAFRTSQSPSGILGVTVESCSYRAVFLSFPLERLSSTGMNQIMRNSLSWLTAAQEQSLSVVSIYPNQQPDSDIPLNAVLTVSGINFSVGNHVYLNEIPIEIISVDTCGDLETLIPAGLPDGKYDITVSTADGQIASLAEGFQVGLTGVVEWNLY